MIISNLPLIHLYLLLVTFARWSGILGQRQGREGGKEEEIAISIGREEGREGGREGGSVEEP